MPKVVFIIEDNKEIVVNTSSGVSILEVAHQNGINLEGACGGSVACATCHVIVDQEFYKNLEPVTEAEEDMLDLAFGLTHYSRLGCQVIITEELDGIKIYLPR